MHNESVNEKVDKMIKNNKKYKNWKNKRNYIQRSRGSIIFSENYRRKRPKPCLLLFIYVLIITLANIHLKPTAIDRHHSLTLLMCTYRTVLILIDPLVEDHVGDFAVLSSDLETTCDHNLDENLPVGYGID